MAIDLKRTGKGIPPSSTETTNNLKKTVPGATVPLQVNIDPEVKRAFRLYAVERDINMSKLFVDIWNYYKTNHG